jgi:pilus assembly protein Flp/PilA
MVSFAAAYLRGFVRKDEGQDLVEYALLVALIALGAVVAVTATGTSIQGVFDNISTALDDTPVGTP